MENRKCFRYKPGFEIQVLRENMASLSASNSIGFQYCTNLAVTPARRKEKTCSEIILKTKWFKLVMLVVS